jgi:hypothetical protein
LCEVSDAADAVLSYYYTETEMHAAA